MKKLLLLLFMTLSLSSCITIIRGIEGEKNEKYLVNTDIKPSQLIKKYVPYTFNDNNKNYVIISWESGCVHCTGQIPNMNKLYELYGDKYTFLAVTTEDTTRIEHILKKLKITDRYAFKQYNDLWGLRASLRNLYYKNDLSLQDIDGYPMNFIIKNDSIVHVSASIERIEWYLEFEKVIQRGEFLKE